MLKKAISYLLIIFCAAFAGCSTVTSSSQVPTLASSSSEKALVAYRLKAQDPIVIQLKGLPAESAPVEDVVDEQGNISLPYIGQVQAAGRTASELEQDIYKAYVDGKIYKPSISVTVTAQQKSFYIWGEVRAPGRYPLTSGTTLLQAVASAGGYSPYANQKKIRLSRAGETYFFNGKELERAPEKDPEIQPDDVINVERSFL